MPADLKGCPTLMHLCVPCLQWGGWRGRSPFLSSPTRAKKRRACPFSTEDKPPVPWEALPTATYLSSIRVFTIARLCSSAQSPELPQLLCHGPGPPSLHLAHLSCLSFFAMGQGLFRMVAMSFFFSSTCSRISASSSSDRDSPVDTLEAKEVDLGAEP